MKLTLQSAVDGGLTHVDPVPFEIGRDSSCELWIGNDPEVSLLHARITRDGAGDCFLHDLEADNGTFLNEERVATGQPKKLGQGDRLRFGRTEYTVNFTDAPLEREDPAAVPPASAPPAAAADGPPGGKKKRNPTLIVLGGLAAVTLVAVGFALAGRGGSEEEKSTSEIVAEAKASTVLVISGNDDKRNGNGSGWVYDAEKGLIVTNAHVVDGSTQFAIGVEGESATREATIVGVAPCDDLAVLKVDDTQGLRTMPLGSQADLEQGDRLLTLGYPGNGTTEDDLQVTDGVVSVVQTRADEAALGNPDFAVYPNVIQTDAAINAGNSGGPSISEEGKLIGVNTLASLETQNQNFAIGVDRVMEVVPDLAKGNSFGWAGFGFAAVTEEDLTAEGLSAPGGGALLVTSVAPGTGAEEEKILVDDLVMRVNGDVVSTRRQYCSAVREVESGDVVPVQVLDSSSDYEYYYDLEVPFE
ncbi:MAG: trypsin-like peptidase domain-containing protein [Solirubrobacterales bacterium]